MNFLKRDLHGYQRIVFAEILVPDTCDVYGDFHTVESIKNFAYGFMKHGFAIDIDHDNRDVSSDIAIIESFIARKGDPDFIEGSWVLGAHIDDDELWQKVLDGELNGFSYEATVKYLDVDLRVSPDRLRFGLTEPDLVDGHKHDFFVVLGIDGRPVAGGTSETDNHSHSIERHTFTQVANGHSHIYNLVVAGKGY